jgi:ATP-dependent Clp protease ATP-binding subunit ClpB
MLAYKGVTMDATPEAIAYLAEKVMIHNFGCRPVKRVIQQRRINEASLRNSSWKKSLQTVSILLDAFNGVVLRNQTQD